VPGTWTGRAAAEGRPECEAEAWADEPAMKVQAKEKHHPPEVTPEITPEPTNVGSQSQQKDQLARKDVASGVAASEGLSDDGAVEAPAHRAVKREEQHVVEGEKGEEELLQRLREPKVGADILDHLASVAKRRLQAHTVNLEVDP
jgi:hypothetical protein